MGAALDAAESTFTTPSKLPLSNDPATNSGPIDGRRRLGGAFAIKIDRICPDPLQPRKRLDTDPQRELVDSVRTHGVLQPITVRYLESENLYRIITGERRYSAAKEAGLTEIPCWIQTPKEEDVLIHQIVENWQRLDMHPYDLADALARLRDANGYSQREIAKVTAKSEGEISKILTLLDLHPAVQKLAREDQSNRITKRHLYALRTLPPEDQQALIEKVQRDALTADETEQLAAKKLDRGRTVPGPGAPVSYHRFKTTEATVSLTFRKKEVSTDDILSALDEARAKATPATHSPTESQSATADSKSN